MLRNTSLASLHHQLINRAQLGIVPRADGLRLNIRHCDRTSVLVILKRLRDEDTQSFEFSILDGIKYSDPVGPVAGQ
jgi:hypothetical protein